MKKHKQSIKVDWKQNIVFLALIYFAGLTCFGQQLYKAPEIAPQAPTVASQMKYIETPISNYNGTTTFSLPLYELKDRDITLPISVSYYSNGLKTDEEASWVGLGFNLNAGGFIQFVKQEQHPNTPLAPYQADLNPSYENDLQTNKLQQGCTFQTPEGETITFDNEADVKYYGYEYPLYMYNFNGYSGKFLRKINGEIVNIDKSNIRFEMLASPQDGFKATTPDGIQYFFEESGRGRSQSPNYSSPCSETVEILGNNTSFTYNLTKIISPNFGIITFLYDTISTKSLPSLSQWYTYSPTGTSNPGLYTITYSDHQEKVLKEINSPHTRIVFVSSDREDIYQGKKLDRIEIYRQGETLPAKKINFDTTYFIGQSGFGDFMTQSAILGDCGITQPQTFVTEDLKKKRLKLVSINFNDDRYHIFDYSTMPLPYKTSLAKDMWGYFNGAPNTTLLPNVDNLGYFDPEVTTYFQQHLFTGNRKALSTYAQGGMLTKITAPTGGYTKITYESNVFSTIPGTLPLIDVEKTVTDIGSGKDIKTFTVPGYTTYAYITIHLNCLAPQYGCESGSCLGYSNQSAGVIGASDNRLYILLEKQNIDGSWTDFRYWDRLSPEMGANCTFSGYINVPGGVYRMTANFPDNMTTGLMGGPWADAKIVYKDFNSATTTANGGGVRVSSVIDYNTETEKYNERYYVYEGGKLITKPDFIVVYDSNILGAENVATTSACGDIIIGSQFGSGCNMLTKNTRHREIIHSESVMPYSYNAMGALVGYSKVTILYGTNSKNGKEVFEYINNNDVIYDYPGLAAGVNGLRKLDNGRLSKKYTYRNATPQASTSSLEIVNYEQYVYEVADYKKFWNYKPDYHPTEVLCTGDWQASTIASMARCFMHFYPVTTGNVRIKSKTEKKYNTPQSGSPVETITQTVEYGYNIKHQLISEKTTNSLNEIVETKSYYPQEMLALNIQASQMQELVTNNRISQPIRTQMLRNNTQISQQQYSYAKDASTGNVLLPKQVFIHKGTGDIDINATADRRFTFTKYDSDLVYSTPVGNGRILEYTEENGVPTTFIWGYNKQFPIAKIEGVAYAVFESLVAALQTASNADDDSCMTGCDEANLRTALNNFRTNALLSNALVTTYTYDPLVGITSITSPTGITEFYEYNAQNELIRVTDAFGKIVKEIKHYYLWD